MLSGLFRAALDALFPQKPLVKELLRMDGAEFARRAQKSCAPAGRDTVALFEYQDPLVREAIWQLKYRGDTAIARLLAGLLHDELLAFLEEYAPLTNFTSPLLVPIPLSRARERERGFNQCELLAEAVSERDAGRNVTLAAGALSKTKDTPSQTRTDTRENRLKNLKGCFAADAALVAGRNIILIDDVTTTGATIAEARRSLLAAGARKVIAFAIAH